MCALADFCLSCGSSIVEICHPLFEGSLCLKCKVNINLWTHLFTLTITFCHVDCCYVIIIFYSFEMSVILWCCRTKYFAGQLHWNPVSVWWGWLPVLLHSVLCRTRGYLVWQCQLLQLSTSFEPSLLWSTFYTTIITAFFFSTDYPPLLPFRCFCKDCLNILVGPETFDKLKDVDPWSCYMCLPSQCNGLLKLRPDWSVRVQEFFVNNSALAFVSDSQFRLFFILL